MKDALSAFTEWIPEGDVEMVSWSDTDQKQLMHEIIGKNIDNARMDELILNWKDCQITFSEKMDSDRRYSLEEALIAADIEQEGRAHNGYCDAYNTALLFAKMETEEEFKLNRLYEEARSEDYRHLSSCIGDLLKDFEFVFCAS